MARCARPARLAVRAIREEADGRVDAWSQIFLSPWQKVWEDAETGANRTLKTVRKTGAKAASAGRYWHLAAPRGTRTDH